MNGNRMHHDMTRFLMAEGAEQGKMVAMHLNISQEVQKNGQAIALI